MQDKPKDEVDELVDYNEDPELGGVPGSNQPIARSPTQSPQSIKSDNEEEDDKSPELLRIEQTQREFAALSEKLAENGFKMRMKVYADPEQSYKYITMKPPNRSLAEILQLVPFEDAAQISEFQGLVYMPQQFLEKYLLPTMQIRKLLETENIPDQGKQPLPGGPETAIMYSLYRQSTACRSTEMDNKLRSLIAHSVTDTVHLVEEITEDRKAKEKSLETYVSQLREVTTVPTVQTICRMTPQDVTEKNQLISKVLSNFEQQLKRDYQAYEQERHQNVLIAKLNYEQQLHILDCNKQYLELSNQRQQIVHKTTGLDVQGKVAAIKDSLKSLQEEMAQQCRDLSAVLGPLDASHLMDTMKGLRDALQDVTYQNAYLVMNNNELTLENSFMTPVQKATIKRIKAEKSRQYVQQRIHPHYIEAYPQGTVMFQPHIDTEIPYTPLTSTENLLNEVDELLTRKLNKRDNLVITPTTTEGSTSDSTAQNAPGIGKGKRSGEPRSRDRPNQAKYLKTEGTPEQGSSSVGQGLGSGKGKQWLSLTNNNIYVESTDGSPGWYNHGDPKGKGKKGKGKGKTYAEGHRYNGNITGIGCTTPSNVPSLNTGGHIQFYTLEELENPGNLCPIKTVPYKTPTANRYMHEPIRTRPPNNWLKTRLDIPETMITENHVQTYMHALECIRKTIQSPYERVIQDRDLGGWINCEGAFVRPEDLPMYPMSHHLPPDLDKYGDLVRVLRYRPPSQSRWRQDVLEYIPNDKYTWKFVKSTMRSYCPDKVGGSRLWNDQYLRDIDVKVLYSLHDYCPGMPVDLEHECELMKLHPFVHNEIVHHPKLPEDKYPPWNLEGTVNNMVQKGILRDDQVQTIESFLKELAKIRKDYEDQAEDWPFEIGRYVLSLHSQRLKNMDNLLTQRIEQVTKQAAEQAAADLALAQRDGQVGAPNGNVQEEIRHDNRVGDGVIP